MPKPPSDPIVELGQRIDALRIEGEASEMMEPTYACGHVFPSQLRGTKAERDLQYWRSLSYNCPRCPSLTAPKEVPAGHLQGDADGIARGCTQMHPCSYFCWAMRNQVRAYDRVQQERATSRPVPTTRAPSLAKARQS